MSICPDVSRVVREDDILLDYLDNAFSLPDFLKGIRTNENGLIGGYSSWVEWINSDSHNAYVSARNVRDYLCSNGKVDQLPDFYQALLDSDLFPYSREPIMVGPFDWDDSHDIIGVGLGNMFYRFSNMHPYDKQLNLKGEKTKR